LKIENGEYYKMTKFDETFTGIMGGMVFEGGRLLKRISDREIKAEYTGKGILPSEVWSLDVQIPTDSQEDMINKVQYGIWPDGTSIISIYFDSGSVMEMVAKSPKNAKDIAETIVIKDNIIIDDLKKIGFQS
jgi:hypothetical protein